jgi:hypothetical protein
VALQSFRSADSSPNDERGPDDRARPNRVSQATFSTPFIPASAGSKTFHLVDQLLSVAAKPDEDSVVGPSPRGIAANRRHALLLTAVLEFLLAGSRVGRWP